MAATVQGPLPTSDLEQIAVSTCESIFTSVEAYDHSLVPEWNTKVIQNILQTLIEKTSGEKEAQPNYKYIVNSTIIQHIGNPAEPEKHGRRGMHSAVGAFWNNEKDGTYSYKWEAAYKKGMDVVLTITWIAI